MSSLLLRFIEQSRMFPEIAVVSHRSTSECETLALQSRQFKFVLNFNNKITNNIKFNNKVYESVRISHTTVAAAVLCALLLCSAALLSATVLQ